MAEREWGDFRGREREKPGGAGKACLGFGRVSERKVEKGEVRFRKAGWLGSVATKGRLCEPLM